MIWFGITGAIFVGTFFWVFIQDRRTENRYRSDPAPAVVALGLASFFGGMALALSLFLVVGVGHNVYDPAPPRYSHSVELVAVSDSSTVRGRFVFGTGSLESGGDYIYYRRTPDGGYVRRSVPADRTVVYEEDREDGELLVFREDDTIGLEFWGERPREEPRYEIRVPEGTVVHQFELNLEG